MVSQCSKRLELGRDIVFPETGVTFLLANFSLTEIITESLTCLAA